MSQPLSQRWLNQEMSQEQRKKSPNKSGLPGSLTTKSLTCTKDNTKEIQLACLQEEKTWDKVGETDTGCYSNYPTTGRVITRDSLRKQQSLFL